MLQFFVCLLCCLWQCNSQVRPILCIIDVPLCCQSQGDTALETLCIFVFFFFVVCLFVCILVLDLYLVSSKFRANKTANISSLLCIRNHNSNQHCHHHRNPVAHSDMFINQLHAPQKNKNLKICPAPLLPIHGIQLNKKQTKANKINHNCSRLHYVPCLLFPRYDVLLIVQVCREYRGPHLGETPFLPTKITFF